MKHCCRLLFAPISVGFPGPPDILVYLFLLELGKKLVAIALLEAVCGV